MISLKSLHFCVACRPHSRQRLTPVPGAMGIIKTTARGCCGGVVQRNISTFRWSCGNIHRSSSLSISFSAWWVCRDCWRWGGCHISVVTWHPWCGDILCRHSSGQIGCITGRYWNSIVVILSRRCGVIVVTTRNRRWISCDTKMSRTCGCH